jgi:putative hemolysin
VAVFFEHIGRMIPMLILCVISAFMSGCETAFSNLSRRQKKNFARSANKLQKMAAKLLQKPKRLLSCLLFGNMVVNVMYFALASVLSVKFGTSSGPVAGTTVAVISFAALLLFGEMIPKSIAYSNSKTFATVTAPLCMVTVRMFSGLLGVIDFLITEPALRLFFWKQDHNRATPAVTAAQFKRLIESSRQRGIISNNENQLLTEVVELGLLKVRNVMKSRVDMTTCQADTAREKISRIMIENNLTKIPIYNDEVDDITGLLYHRDLLLNPDSEISNILVKANFLPEQKSVESLLDFFRSSGTDTAIVVDEYGGIAGLVSLEDIAAQIIGPIEPNSQTCSIEQIGPLEYRLPGNLSAHDWTDAFGIDPTHSRLTTVAGLTIALLGRIPVPGDTVQLKNLTITVEKVMNRRIETLKLLLRVP